MKKVAEVVEAVEAAEAAEAAEAVEAAEVAEVAMRNQIATARKHHLSDHTESLSV